MQTVASILLLLLTVAMTVQADDFSVHRSLPPLKDHRYLFDITTKASAHALKQALKDFRIEQSFKVIGENRFLMVIQSNTTAALRWLSFPSGSKVEQHPVENIAEFLGLYGAGKGWKDYNSLIPKWNSVLYLVEKKLKMPKKHCMTTLELEIRAWAQMVEKPYDTLKPLAYPLVASYPPRVVYVVDINEALLQKLIRGTVSTSGGPGRSKVSTKRIVRV